MSLHFYITLLLNDMEQMKFEYYIWKGKCPLDKYLLQQTHKVLGRLDYAFRWYNTTLFCLLLSLKVPS